LLFFFFRKKVYKKRIDKKIGKLIRGKKKLPTNKIDSLIVSVTSFPERIIDIKYTIYSLLTQSVIPEKIVLWLETDRFPLREKSLPAELLAFSKFNLQIHWCEEDLRSYTKLIPSLKVFPDYFIVIADDDIFYKKRWLEKLWNEHLEYPDDVICHVANTITFDANHGVLPYKKWIFNIRSPQSSLLHFPLGVGGVLYHGKFLFNDIASKKIFMKLAPYADDIWFYFMIILNNTTVRIVKKPYTNMQYVNPYREYNLQKGFKLSRINMDNNKNDIQFKAVSEYYKISLFDLKDAAMDLRRRKV
jgi:hypothetical protein